MIHVCYSSSNLYAKFTGASVLSMLDNADTPPHSLTIHILHDNSLTVDNAQKFAYIAGQYNQLVKFHNVENLCAEQIAEFRNLFINTKTFETLSIASMFRLLIPNLLANETAKAIYLDSDTIVNLDITELWKIPLEDKILGVVGEKLNGTDSESLFGMCRKNIISIEDYFNSGVLLMNLKLLRDNHENILQAARFVSSDSEFEFMDQDILNYCFSTQTLKLPLKFNRFVVGENKNSVDTLDAKIYHYAGSALDLNADNIFNRLFMKYFVRTPFFNENTIWNLYGGARGLYVNRQDFATQVSALMSGKSRAFFASPPNADAVKNIFYVREDEEFIEATSNEALQQMIQSLRDSDGKKIFFILTHEYPIIRQILMQLSFVDGRDFLNATIFLSDANGVPLDSHQFLKLL